MPITLNTLAYAQDSFVTPNKVQYTGPSNSFTIKDLLSLGRTAPKATPSFAGVSRSEVKRVKTVTLSDGSLADAIVTVTCSLPVGMAQSDANALRDDVGDFAISAACGTLFWNGTLTY